MRVMLKVLGVSLGFGFLTGIIVCAGMYISMLIEHEPNYAIAITYLTNSLGFGIAWSVVGLCLFPVLYLTWLNARPVTPAIAALAAGAAALQVFAIVAGDAFFTVCRCREIVDANLGPWDGRAEIAFLSLPGIMGALIIAVVLSRRSHAMRVLE